MKKLFITLVACLMLLPATAQKSLKLTSPDGRITATILTGAQLSYEVSHDGTPVLLSSPLSLTLSSGEVWGRNTGSPKVAQRKVNQTIASPFYRKDQVQDTYNELKLTFKQWGVEFRAYNDGVAYRFVNSRKQPFTLQSEQVDYRFTADQVATVPYVQVGTDGDYESQWHNSFENFYTTAPLSQLNKQHLMLLPLVVDAGQGKKVCITEADLENYPGLYLTTVQGNNSLTGSQAPYPKSFEQGGHNNLQFRVTERESFLAKVEGPRTFPWRVAIVTTADKDLAASDMTYRLGAPSRITDISWIRPGKVAWDWWNDLNLEGVDFVAGVNNATYKYYIDFASANGIEYVILDEGWAVNLKCDLMQVVPEIDVKELVDYAAAKNVSIILWAGYHAFERDMENVCRHYAAMGVKGFKVDFMDRDDQPMVAFNYRAAETCARYNLILDLHGMYKPGGMNRTYPNVLNFEGVFGLEQMKWSPVTVDQIKYDAQIPFIRQVAGPVDYTQGAMRNAAKGNYYPSFSEPMSQGTRCHQLALYVVFESPFNMLCDSPSNYQREPESLQFIAGIPTVWDETIVLDGLMGEYIVTARRNGNTWYIGGITNWTARDLDITLPAALGAQSRTATLFADGVNAHRVGRDYKKTSVTVSGNQQMKIHLAPGGGFAMVIE